MATQTDRDKFKDQEEGVALTSAGMVSAPLVVRDVHSRAYGVYKAGTENAATNVAATVAISRIPRKSKLRGIGIGTNSNIASDNTSYVLYQFHKRIGGTSTLIGTWNTHGGAQGAITTNGPVNVTVGAGLITNSDSEVAAGSEITYTIGKVSAGQLVDPGNIFTFDFEEI